MRPINRRSMTKRATPCNAAPRSRRRRGERDRARDRRVGTPEHGGLGTSYALRSRKRARGRAADGLQPFSRSWALLLRARVPGTCWTGHPTARPGDVFRSGRAAARLRLLARGGVRAARFPRAVDAHQRGTRRPSSPSWATSWPVGTPALQTSSIVAACRPSGPRADRGLRRDAAFAPD
mgnify:CR=1 FL=1